MAFMFENLDVYQKAIDFVDQVTSLTESLPRGYYFLSDQLVMLQTELDISSV